jgi:hypothetical protein
MKKRISREPFAVHYVSTGFLPDIAIHQKKGFYVQEPSYSYIIFCMIMALISICFLFLPIETGPKYILSGGILWAGLSTLIPYFIIKSKSQKIIINKKENKLKIITNMFTNEILIDDLVGLQIVYHNVPAKNDRYNTSGFQLILVEKDKNNNYKRYFLYKNKSQSLVKSLAKQYYKLLKIKVI